MKKIIIAILLMHFGTAYAGSSSGKVTQIIAHTGDVVMFTAGQHINKPGCSTAGEAWALSLSTETGRAMYAAVLSAAAMGRQITVSGANTCDAWGDRERPLYIVTTY